MTTKLYEEGQQVGSWTLLEFLPEYPARWLARCICGTVRPVQQNSLHNGDSRSCGRGKCFGLRNVDSLIAVVRLSDGKIYQSMADAGRDQGGKGGKYSGQKVGNAIRRKIRFAGHYFMKFTDWEAIGQPMIPAELKPPPPPDPEVGQQFGRWTVLSEPTGRRQICTCRCSCGFVGPVRKYELANARSDQGCLECHLKKVNAPDGPLAGVRLSEETIAQRLAMTSPCLYCGQLVNLWYRNKDDPDGRLMQRRNNGRYIGLFCDSAHAAAYHCDERLADNLPAKESGNWRNQYTSNGGARGRRLTAFGETKTVVEWSKDHRCQVCYSSLYQRISRLKWDPEVALTTAAQAQRPGAKKPGPGKGKGFPHIGSGKGEKVTAFGETKTVREWAKDHRCQVSLGCLKGRLKFKWEPETAMTTPLISKREARRFTAFGETKTAAEWAKDPRCRVPRGVLKARLYMHRWEPEAALTTFTRRQQEDKFKVFEQEVAKPALQAAFAAFAQAVATPAGESATA